MVTKNAKAVVEPVSSAVTEVWVGVTGTHPTDSCHDKHLIACMPKAWVPEC